MPQEICLNQIEGNRFMVVDCQTGQPIDFAVGKRGKRKPNAYNLHMKECLKRTSGPIQQRFKTCAEEWRSRK